MTPRIVLITGASSGIGLAAARALAAQGDEIVMVCRDADRAAAAHSLVAEVSAGPAPTVLLADLSSQDAIYRLSVDVHARFDRVDVLVNNAGACFAKRELTVDGLERTFATNYLSGFLLTTLLLDLLEAAPAGRIVNVASETYARRLDFDNLSGERSYAFMSAYKRSMLEILIFSNELAFRLAGSTVTVNSASPGPAKTRFGDNMRGRAGLTTKVAKRLPLSRPAHKAARTIVHVASAADLAGVSGRFFLRGHEKRTRPITHDPDVASPTLGYQRTADLPTARAGAAPHGAKGHR